MVSGPRSQNYFKWSSQVMFHPDFIQAGTSESVSFTEAPIHYLIIQN